MEPKFLLSTASKPFASNGAFPFSLSHKSSFLHKTRLCPVTHLAISAEHLGKTQILGKSVSFGDNNVSLCNLRKARVEKTPFLGKSLSFREKNESLCNLRKTQVPNFPIRAAGAVKRRKELPFDNVIQRDKKLKLVMKIRKILVSQPDRIMSLRELGRYRRALGLEKKRRFIALLKKFPGVFEIMEEGAYSLKFKMTPEAERLYLEEMKIRNEMEDLLVVKLRKLLMMSLDKRILLEKIGHLKTDLGLPLEFQDTICRRYPQYFKVVSTGRGPALELTHWDPELAVSAAQIAEEETRQRELEEKNLIIDRPPRFNRVKLPKGLKLSKGEMRRISQFRDIPYISPYEDFSGIRPGTPEKEKHACGVVHELLSLTVEKRTLVDHLTHFREEFKFSQQLRGMLIRHPDMFYVSLKGDRDSVFLREAYHDSHLIEKNRLLLIKEKLRSLVSVTRFNRRGTPQTDSDEAGKPESKYRSDADEGEEWSDIDNLGSDGFDDDDDDDDDDDGDLDDDWSDDGDDIPPDFSDDEGTVNLEDSKPTKQVNGAKKKEEKILIPVYPDGRPRERW
ncbi:protein WHAT'S THIS FACTOR 1 homolog, chloroplastic-like [Nicotiana tabacum]|uniref:Protein ROOT PRIMORDIUM DEFECTIVE 1-like n=2 Tax=Nicotiana TaxID=4085 RepID=A0A1S3X1Z1_TOBAC|nr:PREDICTED: protein ROOT PRIMORDIUM DEFECTIVE 1 [Nicotiana sylvestris]XP_016433841.1 PREDICTED: protein ROOT PRIMORDIUM DEFECTIVE 1-like [Nicotiana tabacum]